MGPHSGPYSTQDPNKSDDVVDVEAALAYLALKRGERPDDIAKKLGISRRTFYYRVEKLIFAFDRPSRRLMQALEHDRLQDLSNMVSERLDDEASNADFVKLVGESRQLSTARMKLFEDATSTSDELEPDAEVETWVAEAAAENEAEFREVRGA